MSILAYLSEVSIRTVGLAFVAGLVIGICRVRSAAGRHAIWTMVMAGMFAMAAIEPFLPRIPLPLRQSQLQVDSAPLPPRIEQPAPAAEIEPPQVTRAPVSRPFAWAQAIIALYLAGLLAFAIRLALGYGLTWRLARAAAATGESSLFESAQIAVPMTIGLWHPRILLPMDWRNWTPEKLDAALAHERAHVRRGDWAIALLSGVNRCLFWFNPLVWWLERHLAALAEEACDDAALLALGRRAGYAQTLLEMAAAVRASGGRLVSEAMAMARTADVGRRIDRVLDESRRIPNGWSRARWMAVAACSLPLVYVVASVTDAPAEVVRIGPRVVLLPAISEPAPKPVVETPRSTPRTPPRPPPQPAPRQAEEPRGSYLTTVTASSRAPYPYRFDLDMERRLIEETKPVYPPQAIAEGVEGEVRLNITIGVDGHVKQVRFVSGHPLLAAAAQQAVGQFVFSALPVRDEAGAEVDTDVIVSFRLNNPPLVWMIVPPPSMEASPAPPVEFPPNFRLAIPVYKPEPVYPLEMRKAHVQGDVVLNGTIDTRGRVQVQSVSKSLALTLDEQALKVVSQWRFKPATQDGQPVDFPATFTVRFRLE